MSTAHSDPSFATSFARFPLLLTDNKRHDKMTMLRTIILFLLPHAWFHYYLHSSTFEYPRVRVCRSNDSIKTGQLLGSGTQLFEGEHRNQVVILFF